MPGGVPGSGLSIDCGEIWTDDTSHLTMFQRGPSVASKEGSRKRRYRPQEAEKRWRSLPRPAPPTSPAATTSTGTRSRPSCPRAGARSRRRPGGNSSARREQSGEKCRTRSTRATGGPWNAPADRDSACPARVDFSLSLPQFDLNGNGYLSLAEVDKVRRRSRRCEREPLPSPGAVQWIEAMRTRLAPAFAWSRAASPERLPRRVRLCCA